MRKMLKYVVSCSVCMIVAMLVMFPKESMEAGVIGVFLCIDTIIPSLFPFFVCSGIITGLGMTKPLEKLMSPLMKPLFGVSGKGALPFVMGILSGYPIGATCVAELYSKGECSKSECEKLLAFCNNSGPLFILGAIGIGVFKSSEAGRLLYIIHIVSAIITGMILRNIKTEESKLREIASGKEKNLAEVVSMSFSNAVGNILSVCGFVIFFYVVGAMLTMSGAASWLRGFLEIGGGAERISESAMTFEMKMMLISGMTAFSGLSVILQVIRIVKQVNLSPRLYVTGKIIQSIVSVALTWFAMKFIPLSETTALMAESGGVKDFRAFSVQAAIIILIIMVYLNKKAVDN